MTLFVISPLLLIPGTILFKIIDLCSSRTGEFCASATPAATPAILATINYSTTSSGASSTAVLDAVQPYSVAVNPITAQGLVVFQGSSYVDVLDYSSFAASIQTPDLTKIKVTRGQIQTTGSYPHISIEPRLNWAFVTPGGNGNGSIVDLGASGQEIVSLIAVPSSNAAVRKSGTVTITTTKMGHSEVSRSLT